MKKAHSVSKGGSPYSVSKKKGGSSHKKGPTSKSGYMGYSKKK